MVPWYISLTEVHLSIYLLAKEPFHSEYSYVHPSAW
jgi:hypothetical protein